MHYQHEYKLIIDSSQNRGSRKEVNRQPRKDSLLSWVFFFLPSAASSKTALTRYLTA